MNILIISMYERTSGADDPLMPLIGLIGDWTSVAVASTGGSAISRSISYRWLFYRKFVRADSERRSADSLISMEITYFWDASDRTIKASVLASDGSWDLVNVNLTDGTVNLQSRSVGVDGMVQSMTSTLQPVDHDSRSETWSKIRIGEQSLPDAPPIVWRRK